MLRKAPSSETRSLRQLTILNEYLGRRERPLRVIDVKEMFVQMRDEAG
jgi:hypothetical protein